MAVIFQNLETRTLMFNGKKVSKIFLGDISILKQHNDDSNNSENSRNTSNSNNSENNVENPTE